MAAKEEITTDTDWEEMKDFAVEQQQCFYEFLSDCTIYESDQHKYLKQNIGYAIYGPPISNEGTSTTKKCYCKPENSNNTDADITDTVDYDKTATKIIEKIYKKICDHSIKTDSQLIYFGIIYVIIFRSKKVKKETKRKTKTKIKKEMKKEAKQEMETEIKEVKKSEEKVLIVSSLPIFKIRRSIQQNFNSTKSTKQKENTATKIEADYETWYIDINGGVYKNWTDFTKNVNLPECTMVVPKDGFYQPDPSLPITEDYSTVWVEIMDSSECPSKGNIFDTIDVVTDVVDGLGGLSINIASLLIPVGPAIIITGYVASGINKVWTLGRCIQKFVNGSYKKPIIVLHKKGSSHYLSIDGTFMTVPNPAKMPFNTVLSGEIFLNVSMGYQDYKCQTEQTFNYLDTLHFATHLMFFTGSIIKLQFADDIIKNTQGKILDDYRETLRRKLFHKKFNHVMLKAIETCEISEHADVLRYIRNHEQLQTDQSVDSQTLDKTLSNVVWSFEQDKVRISGIPLLNPIKYVIQLIKSDKLTNQSDPFGLQNYSDNFIIDQLEKALSDLVTKFYTSDAYPKNKKLPIQPDFKPLLKEMSFMNIDEEYLKKLFDIVIKLTRCSKDKEDVLLLSFTFIWQYCKANLSEWGINSCYRMQSFSGCKILQKIITVVFEAINMILDNLYSAFLVYMENIMHS